MYRTPSSTRRRFGLVLLAAAAAAAAACAPRPAAPPDPATYVHAARVREPIRLDGRIAERGWARARPSVAWRDRAAGDLAAEAHVLYDDEALYVAAELLGRTAEDDVSGETLEVTLEPASEGRAVTLVVRPDGSTAARGARGGAWTKPWRAGVHVTRGAWFVEVRVPFSSLGARPETGRPWRIRILRRSRGGEEAITPAGAALAPITGFER